jgi:hypothetical protein
LRRFPLLLLILPLLFLCGLLAYAAPPRGGEPPKVAFQVEPPKRAFLREPTVLEVRARNVGAEPVHDFGVKINRGYANVFTIVDLEPRATIDDASTEKRLYFGPLAPGESRTYRVTFSPQRLGDFNLNVKAVAAQRGLEPLVLADAETGRTEVVATTSVVNRP